mmetsp:Transcript_17851/g.17575  ORF Transcript_17851/g.17575 Transcript_17851/m.17575 type:complete len:184 (+) Transcript_17851:2-553(+)
MNTLIREPELASVKVHLPKGFQKRSVSNLEIHTKRDKLHTMRPILNTSKKNKKAKEIILSNCNPLLLNRSKRTKGTSVMEHLQNNFILPNIMNKNENELLRVQKMKIKIQKKVRFEDLDDEKFGSTQKITLKYPQSTKHYRKSSLLSSSKSCRFMNSKRIRDQFKSGAIKTSKLPYKMLSQER